MNTWIRRTLQVGLISTGFVLVAAGGAQADTDINQGFLNGNKLVVPIQLPVNVCGNAVAVVGKAQAACVGGAAAVNRRSGSDGDLTINKGFLNGNIVKIPVQVPINVCGNAVAVIGKAQAFCQGGAVAVNRRAAAVNDSRDLRCGDHRGSRCHDEGDLTINKGFLNGNIIKVPVQVPINVCGNAVAVIGKAQAFCKGGAVAVNRRAAAVNDARDLRCGDHRGSRCHDEGDLTINKGFLNGNIVKVPVQVPINVCGNAIALIGKAAAACKGGAVAVNQSHRLTHLEHAKLTRTLSEARDLRTTGPDGDIGSGGVGKGPQGLGHGPSGDWDDDSDCRSECHGEGDLTINKGFVNGNKLIVPIQVPVNVCGNAIAVIGKAQAACSGGAGAVITRSARDFGDTTINKGWLNGNKVKIPVQVPVDVSGNALAIWGKSAAFSRGGSAALLG